MLLVKGIWDGTKSALSPMEKRIIMMPLMCCFQLVKAKEFRLVTPQEENTVWIVDSVKSQRLKM